MLQPLRRLDEERERSRKYRATHLDECRARVRRAVRVWKKRNPDKVKAYWQKNANNPDVKAKARARSRAWYKVNKVKAKAKSLRYRTRHLAAAGGATIEQIEARVAFFGGARAYCGGPFQALEHGIPLARGGTNWSANLRPSCTPCNLAKGTMTVSEFLGRRLSLMK